MNNVTLQKSKRGRAWSGLSGSAAALLLASEGAQVTVLDSADENNLLKSTLDNLRAHGVRVVCGSEAESATHLCTTGWF
jgi:UDP-N-acetylmuramoylalanine-D-glutamate ligase